MGTLEYWDILQGKKLYFPLKAVPYSFSFITDCALTKGKRERSTNPIVKLRGDLRAYN